MRYEHNMKVFLFKHKALNSEPRLNNAGDEGSRQRRAQNNKNTKARKTFLNENIVKEIRTRFIVLQHGGDRHNAGKNTTQDAHDRSLVSTCSFTANLDLIPTQLNFQNLFTNHSECIFLFFS